MPKPKTTEKPKYEEKIAKAIEAVKNPEAKDDVVALARLMVKDNDNTIPVTVGVGKCTTGNRVFPCVVVGYGNREYTLSAGQLRAIINVLHSMSDDLFNAILMFLNQTRRTPRRRRLVNEEEAPMDMGEEEEGEEQ